MLGNFSAMPLRTVGQRVIVSQFDGKVFSSPQKSFSSARPALRDV
jgi:hypothetical protein